MVLLALDPSSPTPPYEQVRSQIAAAIECGGLGPGAKLPTVRQLARDLNLAVNTVARAYRELELAGLVETQGRHGTFVAARSSPARELAVEATRSFLQRMSELGFDAAGATAFLRHEAEGAGGQWAAHAEPAARPRLAEQS